MADWHDDPRVDSAHVRVIPFEAGEVILVGVVHDHPASIYRTRAVVSQVNPRVLAVELPPLAVPLFRQYAATDTVPPSHGGEISAAIQAANTERVVGIDGPSIRFLPSLLRTYAQGRSGLPTGVRITRNVVSATGTALRCRMASWFSFVQGPSRTQDWNLDWTDPPARLAAHERGHLETARSIIDATNPHPATQVRDEARERWMATQLDRLRLDGSVVAVVGHGHLEALSATLSHHRR